MPGPCKFSLGLDILVADTEFRIGFVMWEGVIVSPGDERLKAFLGKIQVLGMPLE